MYYFSFFLHSEGESPVVLRNPCINVDNELKPTAYAASVIEVPELTGKAVLSADYGDASAILNGTDRRIFGNDNGYFGKTNNAITYSFEELTHVEGVRLVFDSDLDREYTDGNPDAMHTSCTLFFPKSITTRPSASQNAL